MYKSKYTAVANGVFLLRVNPRVKPEDDRKNYLLDRFSMISCATFGGTSS
jgi:hypothetical protein